MPVQDLAWLRQVNFSAKLTLRTFGRITSIIAKMLETSSQNLQACIYAPGMGGFNQAEHG
jgi:hypothetical protein